MQLILIKQAAIYSTHISSNVFLQQYVGLVHNLLIILE